MIIFYYKTKLSKLSTLDLMNCEVTSADGYRETMFNMLPQLKYLDNIDKDGGKKGENVLLFCISLSTLFSGKR